MEQKNCLECDKVLEGRRDKKFCDAYCKSAYHYKQNQESSSIYQKVDRQLKKNRSILKAYNKAGKATAPAQILHDAGFDPRYFTHYWKNSSGDVYLFAYEYGFLARKENGKRKYILIIWQAYMERK